MLTGQMDEAFYLLRRGESYRYVEKRCENPRQTLTKHMRTGSFKRKLDGKTMLTEKQENDLRKKSFV